MKPHSNKGTKPPAFKQAAELLAKTLAVAIAFFATGPSYSASVPMVREFVANSYSPELIGIASLGWFIITAISVFAFATLSVFLLVQMISVWLSKISFKLK